MAISLKNFLRNMKYLFSYSLKDREKDNAYNTLLLAEDMIKYGEIQPDSDCLKILNISDTLDLLISTRKSFCRIGDGEINLIEGKSIPFQSYDSRLGDYLKRIVSGDESELLVGINYHYFHSTKQLNDINRRFYLLDIKKYRDYLIQNCNKNRVYIAAGFNQVYIFTESYDYEAHFNKIKELIKNEEIVLFCGEGVFANIEYNIFDFAKDVKYVKCPSKDSFSQFDNILDQCRRLPKSKVLAFILGPTSKALVYELAQNGFTAWDIGHLAKDYDYYMKGTEKSSSSIHGFFSAD